MAIFIKVDKDGKPLVRPKLDVLKDRFRHLWSEALNLSRRSVEQAHDAGTVLVEIKAEMKHGEWLPWLESEGVEQRTASRLMKLASVEIGQIVRFDTVQAALEYHRANEKRDARAKREAGATARAMERNSRDPSDLLDIRHCSIADLAAALEPASVDAIITDPPYEKKSIPVFAHLRDFAAKVLRPGGSMVVLTGSMYLPDWIARLEGCDELTYRYLMGVRLAGANATNHPRLMADAFKPILLYEKAGSNKDGRRKHSNLIDLKALKEQEADHHKWQQQFALFENLLGKFASPGDVVCDPFLGGGTTAVAALARGCGFVGCDVDAKAVDATKRRLGV